MCGETPDVLDELLEGPREQPPAPAELPLSLWDPSTQLRFRAKRSVPARPDGAPNRAPADRREQPSEAAL